MNYDEYIKQITGSKYGSSMNSAADSIVNNIPIAGQFNQAADMLGGVVDMAFKKDQWGNTKSDVGSWLKGFVNPMDANLNIADAAFNKGNDTAKGQLALNVALPGVGNMFFNRDNKRKAAGMDAQLQTQERQQQALQKRMGKYMQPQKVKQGGMINGNAYVNDEEYVVSPSRPQEIKGGSFQQQGPGLYEVNAYKEGTDNVLSNIQPGSKVINNELSELIKPLARKRKYQQGKLDKATTALRKDTIQKNIDNYDQQIKTIIAAQSSNPKQDQSRKFINGGLFPLLNNVTESYEFPGSKDAFNFQDMYSSSSPLGPSMPQEPPISISDQNYMALSNATNTPKIQGNKPLEAGDNSFSSWVNNDETSALTLSQLGYGLGQMAYGAFDPVSQLPESQLSRLRSPKPVSPVSTQADWYMRNMPSNSTLSALGVTDPRIWMAGRAQAGEQYSQAKRQDELINKQIERQNIEELYRTMYANVDIDEKNRQYEMQRKMYYDQGKSKQIGAITEGAGNVVGSLAKIIPMLMS